MEAIVMYILICWFILLASALTAYFAAEYFYI